MNQGFSQYQQNIQRQSKEQRAVGSLLSGVAITLIILILLVAITASFGGWVLYRQIKDQSVTVAQLDTKLSHSIQALGNDLKDTNTQVERLVTLAQAQKQQIASLQNQIEDARTQARKESATLKVNIQKLERRIYDLERNANAR